MRFPIRPLALFSLLSSVFSLGTAAETATPTPAPAPNILIAVADDWTFGHAGAYGCKWVKTPAFDRVAKQGVLFTNAYTPNAKCAPSRASILTGRNSWQLEEAGNHYCFFPSKFKTYPEALIDHGYFVGATGKKWSPGTARKADGSDRNLTGLEFDKRHLNPATKGISPVDYAANFADFLDAAKGEPFCFWYGGNEPHRDYEYGSGVAKGGKNISEIDRVPAYWPDNEVVRNDMLDYAFEIEHFDTHLGRMIAELEKRGLLENTLIIVTADNGMPFPRAKGNQYEHSNHMPFAVMWPKGISKPGRVVSDYVSFIDLAPTFLEAAGLPWEKSGLHASPGRSILPLLAAEKSGRIDASRDHVLIGMERHDIGRPLDKGYPIRGIVKDGWLYLHNFAIDRWPACDPETGYLNCDGGATKTEILKLRTAPTQSFLWQLCFGKRPYDELYYLQSDAECMINLAASPVHSPRLQVLHDQLFKELNTQEDPRMAGKGDIFDTYLFADPRYRGYYEKFKAGTAPVPTWVEKSDFESAPID